MSYHYYKSTLSLTPETERRRERKKGRAKVRNATKYSYLSYISSVHIYQPPHRRCDETTELDCREPIINTPPHLYWHPKGIHEKEQFWLEEHRKRVRRYDTLPGHGEPHKLRGSMKKCAKPPSTVISALSKSTYINHRTGVYCFAQTHEVHLRQPLLPEVSYNLRNQADGTNAWRTHTPNGHNITDSPHE